MVRKAIGLTQPEMAALLGVSRDTVQKIERNELKLSRDLASKYRLATGCDLREGGEGEAELEICATSAGKPLTKETFALHRFVVRAELGGLEERIQVINSSVELLVRAAEYSGIQGELERQLEVMMMKAVHGHQLKDALLAVLKGQYSPINAADAPEDIVEGMGVAPIQAGKKLLSGFSAPNQK